MACRIACLAALAMVMNAIPARAERPKYPETKAQPVTDELHGTKLIDPYRWLEDDKSTDVAAWVEQQNAFTRTFLDGVSGRDKLRARLEKLIRVPSTGVLVAYDKRYFYTHRDPQQNHAVLFVRDGGPDAAAKKVLDPNTFSADGTVALDWYFPSPDGALIAYGKSEGGSENSTLYVLDVKTGKQLSEAIPGTKFCSLAWQPDGSGFYYTRYPQPGDVAKGDENYYNHLYYHKLGAAWKSDRKIWGEGEPKEKRAGVNLSADHKHLFSSITLDWAKNDLFVRPIADTDGKFLPVVVGKDALSSGDYLGDRLLVLTNYKAPRYRVLEADLKKGDIDTWKELIPQGKGVIQAMDIIGGRIVLTILEDVCSKVLICDAQGKSVGEIALPVLGAVSGVNGNHGDDELFFAFESFAFPPTTYRYNLKSGKLTQLERLAIDINPDAYVIGQVRYKSKDGTMVPMFVVYKKGTKLDGNNPCVLWGYGGFNISMTPRFRASLFPWLDAGGVYAVANIRGGGEFGAEWHHAGRLEKKQNCFDDFIYAAKALCGNGYTNPQRLAAWGGSNGGLLMGAMITQAPEQFRAIICAVPLLDMIRYHQFSMARFWIQEYGSSENAEQFKYILKYSPYQNVKAGTKYPATLIETGDSDGRVDPCHARKMAALLQAQTGGDLPILLRYESKAGHGAGKPITKVIDASTDEWSFLMKQLGVN